MKSFQFSLLCIAFTLLSLNYSSVFVNPYTRNSTMEKAKALVLFDPQLNYLKFYTISWKTILSHAACNFAQFVCSLAKYGCNSKHPPPPVAVPPPKKVTTPKPHLATASTTTTLPTILEPSGTVSAVTNPQSKYMVVEDKMNWMESHINCVLAGYNLTTIKDSEEFDHLQTVIANAQLRMVDFFWTAGNDLFREGNFTWISNGEKFTDFYPAGNIEPTGLPTEHCVFLYFNTTFNLHVMADFPCDFKAASICKKIAYV